MKIVLAVALHFLIGVAVAQVCGQPNYTVVDIPAGGVATVTGTFTHMNGDAFPILCGYYIRTSTWEPNAQIVATVKAVSFVPSSANSWSAVLARISQGTNPPVVGATLATFSVGGTVRVPLTNGLNLQDFVSDGTMNMTNPSLQAVRKEMQLTVNYNNGGNDRFTQPPVQTFTFTIEFTVALDQCPSESVWFLPRKLSVSPDFNNLNHVCQNYNNKSCCNPGSAVAAATNAHVTSDPTANTFEEHPNVVPQYNLGGTFVSPIDTYYDHYWAANDTECYHYYQVTACGARCSPNAVSKGFISTNWDSPLMNDAIGATTGRRTFRICSSFCDRVWASCKKERFITDSASLGRRRATPLSALYVDATSFCLDYFRYTYPPAAATQTNGATTGSKRVAIAHPTSLTTGPEALLLEVATDKCFDPAIENGVAGVAVSTLVLLLCLLLSL